MRKKLIIIVEDDPLVSLYLKVILEEIGFEVINDFISVENSIKLIVEKNPVLVFIDINLNEELSGIDLGYFLLEHNKIPYVYLTSSTDQITINRINNTRPYGYFSKPLNRNDIVININIILYNYSFRNGNQAEFISDNSVLIDDSPFVIKKTIQYINNNIYPLGAIILK